MDRQHIDTLTEHEIRVLELAAQGLTNNEIAQQLSKAERTVRTQLTYVYEKLGVGNRTEATIYAFRFGLVTIEKAWAAVAQRQRLLP